MSTYYNFTASAAQIGLMLDGLRALPPSQESAQLERRELEEYLRGLVTEKATSGTNGAATAQPNMSREKAPLRHNDQDEPMHTARDQEPPLANNDEEAPVAGDGPAQHSNRRRRGQRSRSPSPSHPTHNAVVLQGQPQLRFVPHDLKGQSLDTQVHALLAQFAAPTFQSSTHNPRAWLRLIRETGLEHDGPGDLTNIIRRCATSSLRSKDVGGGFIAMLSWIQLAFKCDSLLSSMAPRATISGIHSAYVAHLKNAPAARTFSDWISCGKKFAYLVGGGSIYLLIIIAGLDLRWDIAKVPQEVVFRVAEILRKPSKAKESQHRSISSIIATVAIMREQLPLRLQMNFETLNCTDLEISDRFFDQLKMKRYKLPKRSRGAWASCNNEIAQ